MATLATCGALSSTFTGVSSIGSGCTKAGGIKAIYVAKSTDIDLVTSSTSPTNFNATTEVLNNIVMQALGGFYKIDTDGGESTFTYEKQDNGSYLSTLTMFFEGTGCTRAKALKELNKICPMVVVVQLADCTQVISLTNNGGVLELPAKKPKLTGDSLTAGTLEGDPSSQTAIITWTSADAPICGALTTIDTSFV